VTPDPVYARLARLRGAVDSALVADAALRRNHVVSLQRRWKQEAEASDFDPLAVRALQDITRLLDGWPLTPGCVNNVMTYNS
jgi:hypothetical protein